MITVENVSKRFGKVEAVRSVSFEVRSGETLVLLGTSGSGKTTMLRMINRLIDATSGDILLHGKSIFTTPPELLRRGMGYVLQHHGLFPHLTVAENIAVVPKILKWSAAKIRSRITELLAKLQLAESLLDVYPAALSGGQQQRVGLARALAAEPPVLLMDEPFGALDPVTRTTVREELSGLDELKGKTVILVTHDIQEAFALGDRIAVMNEGAISQIGTAATLLLQPANAFISRFFNEHRLEWELKSLQLEALWNKLPDNAAPADAVVTELPTSATLFDCFETISKHPSPEILLLLKRDADQQQKAILFSDILRAWNQLKTTS